jgi:hypothetical protein
VAGSCRTRPTKRHEASQGQHGPRYFEGDDWSPANLPPDQIWSVQQRMIAAGLIPKGAEIRKGYWDDTTRQAYRQLLGEANGAGFSADQQFTVRENSEAINKQRSQAASVYLRPDPATLRIDGAQGASPIFSAMATSRPTKRVERLVERVRAGSRARRSKSTRRAPMTQPTRRARPATPPGRRRSRTSILTARFEEYIRQQYRPEIKHDEQVVDMTNSRNSLLGNVFALDQMIGGPGQ